METTRNSLDQPIGFALPQWNPPKEPAREPMTGRFCHLEPLEVGRHAEELYEANGQDEAGRMWTYLPYGPFESLAAYRAWMEDVSSKSDPLFLAIKDGKEGRAVGVASYLRIHPAGGSIEVGHLAYSPLLQQTPAATEAMYLMMKRAFDLGYRRYEWKCDALNAPSRSAAERLGFQFEGVFRQAMVVKGRNRDTAWYAVIDRDWPELQKAFEQWLDPANFDETGKQRVRLSSLTKAVP